MKVYSKYISKSENKCINYESLLQVHSWIRKCMTKFQNFSCLHMAIFFTSLLYAFQKQVQSILEVYPLLNFLMGSKYTWKNTSTNHFLDYFPIIFIKLQTLEVKISSKPTCSILIFQAQKFIWSIVQFQLDKILVEILQNLWATGLMVRVQVYQTRYSSFKIIM